MLSTPIREHLKRAWAVLALFPSTVLPISTFEPIMRLLRRERQEGNFGTVCTSFAQGSAAIRRDAHLHQTPLSGQGYVTDDRPKSARSRACPSSAHFCGACELNVPHILGQPCASERSSWTFSHLFMIEVTADTHMYRGRHLVPCCPLHECSAGVVDFSTVYSRST